MGLEIVDEDERAVEETKGHITWKNISHFL